LRWWSGEFALQPLADWLLEILKQRQVLHADEWPVKRPDLDTVVLRAKIFTIDALREKTRK
jgi:hypothetical protein